MPSDRVFEIKDLVITYSCGATTPATVFTDMPGGTMSSRVTPTLAATSGREKHIHPLDGSGYLEGTMIRLKLAPTAAFKLAGGGFHVRPVGLYIDGSIGETWQTQDISIGA